MAAPRFIFSNPAFEFQARYRLGLAATGGADLGEFFAAAQRVADELVTGQMKKNPSTRQFIGQMLWTFQADSPSHLFRELKEYTMADSISRIECETLVVNSSDDKVAGSYEQAKLFFGALKCPKTYLEFTEADGAERHCQAGAPMIANERILNWLDDRLNR